MKHPNEVYDDGLLDVTGAAGVEIVISPGPGGTLVVHVNTERGVRLRVCRITGPVAITDNRERVGAGNAPTHYGPYEAIAWANGFNFARDGKDPTR